MTPPPWPFERRERPTFWGVRATSVRAEPGAPTDPGARGTVGHDL